MTPVRAFSSARRLLAVAPSIAVALPVVLAVLLAASPAGATDQQVAEGFSGQVREASMTLPEGALSASSKLTGSLLSDSFEGSFPGSIWTLYHPSSGAADVDWGRTTARRSDGNASIWCAAAGGDAPGPGGDVPANTTAWVIAGPFNLSGVTAGALQFDLWLDTETNFDYFQWLASFDGQNFSGLQTSSSTSGWETISQDLTDWGSVGDVTGRSQVWIAFIYTSDGSVTHEGAYVDRVNLSTDGGGGGGGSECGTYVLTADNDDNASSGSPDGDWGYCLFNNDAKHPIDFHFDIDETSVSSAQLLLLCHDVDENTDAANPEIDKVYVNGAYLGDLTGADDEDSTTIFTVPPSALNTGRNRVDIQVNQSPTADPDDWCVEIKQAQLIINGGCEGQADCRSVTTDRASYAPGETVAVTYEIDTSAGSQQIRVESNLLDPTGINVAGTDQVYTTSGSANDPRTVNLALPAGAAGGTYTAQILVFDATSGQLESSCDASFTVTGGGGGGCSLTCSTSVPATATVGQTVTLQGTATVTGCNETIDYFWFPDVNTTATIFDRTATWQYQTPGTYTWSFVALAGEEERCERRGTINITSGGGGGSHTTWIPVGSRATGANNSIWRTDMGIFNPNSVAVTVTVTIYTTAGPVSNTVTIGPLGQRVLTDVVGWLIPNANLSGAIRVSSAQTVVVTSRTYNRFSSGAICLPLGTLGQALDAWSVADALGAGQAAWLPHLIQNGSFRTNIGYTNLGSSTATFVVRLYNANGVQVGQYSETLAPGQWKQANQPFVNVAGLSNMNGGSAKITMTSGSGVMVYGSVIDFITNDPTTITMRRQ